MRQILRRMFVAALSRFRSQSMASVPGGAEGGVPPQSARRREIAHTKEEEREIDEPERDCSTPTRSADSKERHRVSFYRGETVNYFADRADFESKTFLQDFVLKGWLPSAPFLTRDTKITAFGSCFAANITRHLTGIGYDLSSKRAPDIYISRLGDGMVNAPAILGQLEWALENTKMPANLWHGFNAESYRYDEKIRLETRDVFLATDFFIITLGLSEVWYDIETGGTFWRAIPKDAFNPSRHSFRVLSVEETKRDIERMRGLIRHHVPGAKILFTVSPIPLAATFRPVSCMTANAVSKAVIRAALDEVLRAHPDELNETLFYFPSMEILQLAFYDPWAKGRHPRPYVLDTIMKTFEAAYCVGEGTLDDANALLHMHRMQNMAEIGARVAEFGGVVEAAERAAREQQKKRLEAKKRDRPLVRGIDTAELEQRRAARRQKKAQKRARRKGAAE